MADRNEDKGTADNGAKNAEEHDCLRRELETLIKLVEVIDKTTKQLDKAQQKSLSDLMGRIFSLQDQINRMSSRIDGVHGKVDSAVTELKRDLAGLIDQTQTRINQVGASLTEKLDGTDKRIDDLREDVKNLASWIRWGFGVGIALIAIGLAVIGLLVAG